MAASPPNSPAPALGASDDRGCRWVAVTGPVGSGKSTLLQRLLEATQDRGGVRIMEEPVAAWAEEGWLGDYYADPARYGLGFQLRVLASQAQQRREARADPQARVVFSERSPLDGRDVFLPLMRARGVLSDREVALFEECALAMAWCPDAVVYVDVSDEECQRRVRLRNRTSESQVDSAYLSAQHEQYGRALRAWAERGVPLVVVANGGAVKAAGDELVQTLLAL